MQQNEHENKPTHTGNLAILDTIDRIDETTPRQTITLALILGVCLVFLASMLGVSHLDEALTVAVIAFSAALPTLGFGLIFSFYKAKKDVHGWRLFHAILIAAWIIEGIGSIAAAVGVYFVVLHLSLVAAMVLLIATFGVGIACLIGVLAWGVIMAFIYSRKQKKSPPSPAP